MSTVVARLEAILSANTADFERAMGRSESSMKKIGRVAGTAGLAIAAGVGIGLEKSVKAAIDAQQANVRLTQAYKNAGVAIGPLRKQIDGLEAAGRKLGFTDEDITSAMGSLITATHNQRKASKDLAVAQDLARFKGIGLQDATKMLTTAMAGSQRAVKQLGIIIPSVTTNYDKLKASGVDLTTHEGHLLEAHAKLLDKMATGNAVIDATRDHVKGQGKAYADTAAGGMAQFHAQLQNIEIEIGNKLLPVMTAAIKWITANWPQISKVIRQAWETDIKPVLTALIALIDQVVRTVRDHWSTIGPLVKDVTNIIKTQVAIIVGVLHFVTDLLRGDWSKAWQDLKGIVGDALRSAVGVIKFYIDVIVNLFTPIGKAIADAFVSGAKWIEKAVTDLFHKVIGWVKGALGIASPSTVFHQIGVQSVQGFIDGVGSMAGVLKDAVVHMATHAASKLGHAIVGAASAAASGGSITGNAALGKSMAASMGWSSPQEWGSLNMLWQRESGWSNTARNPTSGAYGIPQALPPTKMPYAAQAKGGSHADAQIQWGLNYIAGRYGNPIKAWAHEQSFGWYDKGGWLPTGLSLAMNNTGAPERVVGPGGGGDTVIVQVGPEEVARVVFDQIRGQAQVFTRRNGRLAFGG